jgi:hypothetical protein
LKLLKFSNCTSAELMAFSREFRKHDVAGGFLSVLQCAVAYGLRCCRDTYIELLAAANHSWTVLHSVPGQLLGVVPNSHDAGESLASSVDRVRGMSDGEFGQICGAADPSLFSIEFNANETMTVADFQRLAQAKPWLALHVWSHELETRKDARWDPEISGVLVELLCSRGDLLHTYFTACGTLMHGDGGRKLRKAIADIIVPDEVSSSRWSPTIRPFALLLPAESSVLCQIATAFASGCSFGRERYAWDGGDVRGAWVRAIRKYVAGISPLHAIAQDRSQSRVVRSCAVILAAMHAEDPRLFLQYEEVVVEGSVEKAFVAAATISAIALLDGESIRSLSTMVMRLMAALPDPENERWRSVWDGTIARWREQSVAPVTRANVLPGWLGS